MDCFEKRNIKAKLKEIPLDTLSDFLKQKMPREIFEEFMRLETNSNYHGTSYDEYLLKEFPEFSWFSERMNDLTFMNQTHNDFLPLDLLPCYLPNWIKKYKDSLYFIYLSNDNIEIRFKLPNKINICFYCTNSHWKYKLNCNVEYRQQIVLGHTFIDNKYYFFLRGYGSKGYNRYAISVYCPDDNNLWKSPSYTEILTLYKDILSNDNIPIFKKNLERVISGLHPKSIEIENLNKSIFIFNKEIITIEYQIFLHFIYVVVKFLHFHQQPICLSSNNY